MVSALHKFVTYLLRHLPTYLHPRTHTGLVSIKFNRCYTYLLATVAQPMPHLLYSSLVFLKHCNYLTYMSQFDKNLALMKCVQLNSLDHFELASFFLHESLLGSVRGRCSLIEFKRIYMENPSSNRTNKDEKRYKVLFVCLCT